MIKQKLIQKATYIGIKQGFIYIGKELIPFFPQKSALIDMLFDDNKNTTKLHLSRYSKKDMRLYGLSRWYKKHSATPGSFALFEVLSPNKLYRITFLKLKDKK